MDSHTDIYHRTWLRIRETVLRDYFGVSAETELLDPSTRVSRVTDPLAAHLDMFNLEWHVIPSAIAVPFDDQYSARLYRRAPATFREPLHHGPSVVNVLPRAIGGTKGGLLRWRPR